MKKGRRLAIDVGKVRIGLAVCDAHGILASPLPAIARSNPETESLGEIESIADECQAIEIYVGDPISLSGGITASTQDARDFAAKLAASIAIPVRLVDERLTTVTASSKLRLSGKDSRESKALIDSASAVEILEQVLLTLRNSSVAPGRPAGEDHA
jgi:putative Holliday junction resolvase